MCTPQTISSLSDFFSYTPPLFLAGRNYRRMRGNVSLDVGCRPALAINEVSGLTLGRPVNSSGC